MRSRLALAVLALILAIGAAEIVLRVLGIGTEASLFTVNEREFRDVPGIFEPDQDLVQAAGTRFEHRTRINGLGYRGGDATRAKPPGEYRIVVIGDSFTWGHNVPDDATLPAALESRLRQTCPSVRVLNAGISGMTILGEDAMALRARVLAPDLLLLVAHENDLDELASSRLWEGLEANRHQKSTPPVSWFYPLVRRSALWKTLLDVRRARAPYLPQRAGTAAALESAPDERLAAARREYADRLAALRDSLQRSGVPLRVVLYPHPASVERGRATPNHEFVGETSRRLGLPTLDLLDTLRASGEPLPALFLLPEDYHPSARGHAVAAAFLAAHLVEGPADASRLAPGGPDGVPACPIRP